MSTSRQLLQRYRDRGIRLSDEDMQLKAPSYDEFMGWGKGQVPTGEVTDEDLTAGLPPDMQVEDGTIFADAETLAYGGVAPTSAPYQTYGTMLPPAEGVGVDPSMQSFWAGYGAPGREAYAPPMTSPAIPEDMTLGDYFEGDLGFGEETVPATTRNPPATIELPALQGYAMPGGSLTLPDVNQIQAVDTRVMPEMNILLDSRGERPSMIPYGTPEAGPPSQQTVQWRMNAIQNLIDKGLIPDDYYDPALPLEQTVYPLMR